MCTPLLPTSYSLSPVRRHPMQAAAPHVGGCPGAGCCSDRRNKGGKVSELGSHRAVLQWSCRSPESVVLPCHHPAGQALPATPCRLRADTAKDSGVQSAIVGGTRAPRGRYPWVASLRVNNGSLAHFCGASLVAPQIGEGGVIRGACTASRSMLGCSCPRASAQQAPGKRFPCLPACLRELTCTPCPSRLSAPPTPSGCSDDSSSCKELLLVCLASAPATALVCRSGLISLCSSYKTINPCIGRTSFLYVGKLLWHHLIELHPLACPQCLVEANGSWSVAMYSFPQVRLGGWELNGGVYEAHEVLRACVHESYNAVTNANDVALLLLNSTSKLTPIKLPPSELALGCRWCRGRGTSCRSACGSVLGRQLLSTKRTCQPTSMAISSRPWP